MKVAVRKCPRCGESHESEFVPFGRAAGPYTHWAMCPVQGEPILHMEKPTRPLTFLRALMAMSKD